MTCDRCGRETKDIHIVLEPSTEGYPRLLNKFFCEVCWRKRHGMPWIWARALQVLQMLWARVLQVLGIG